jgi:hypothetical protein
MFFCVDKITGRRPNLKTTDKDAAQQVIEAKNQAERQPVTNSRASFPFNKISVVSLAWA